jgi:tRNA pseudouridine55 synthase
LASSPNDPTGFLVVDKPAGPTSHDIVAQARAATGIKKIGHAGTLDPPATGVLILALGQATRLIRYVQDFDKEYEATVRFGIGTTTLDSTGDEVARQPMPITATQLEEALGRFRGSIEQVPPMFSALKVKGRRLHDMARAGLEVERTSRRVQIYGLELKSFKPGDYPEADLRVICSKGTYVRTLADDLAVSLGGRAHLTALRRTRVGGFHVDAALDDWEGWEDALVAPAAAAHGMEQFIARAAEQRLVVTGRPLLSPGKDGPLAVLDETGRLMAVYRRTGDEARAEVVLS